MTTSVSNNILALIPTAIGESIMNKQDIFGENGLLKGAMNKDVLRMYENGEIGFHGWPLTLFYKVISERHMLCSNGFGELAKRVLDGRGFAKVGTSMVFNPFILHWMGRSEYARLTRFIDNYNITKAGVYAVAYMRNPFIASNINDALENEVPMLLKNIGENPTIEEKQSWLRTNDSKNIAYDFVDLSGVIGRALLQK